jgi:hypothetical protein
MALDKGGERDGAAVAVSRATIYMPTAGPFAVSPAGAAVADR